MKWLLVGVMAAGALLRLSGLAERPMHADEAILADRFGTLLETGAFHYDPAEYHGPALAYATLPSAWLSQASRYTELNETVIRAVPAVFGLILIALSFWIGNTVGRTAGLLAALFTAFSPALVYYSRYYIPETLLVCFSAASLLCGVQFARRHSMAWAAAAGACAGLMYATKETAVLAFCALAVGLLMVRPRVPARYWIAGAGAAAAVSVALYSPSGVWDSLRALGVYAERGIEAPRHAHPWHHYFGLLLRSGEAALLLPAFAIPFLPVFENKLVRFLFGYSAALTLLYSALPYKTPWCLAGFLHGWALLAAIAGAELIERWGRRATLAAAVLALGLLAQSWRYSGRASSDPANPYVYAHTLPDVYRIRDRVQEIALRHPSGTQLQVDIFSADNWWPLPWYLREYPNVRWWSGDGAKVVPGPLVLLSPAEEDAVAKALYENRPPGERELYGSLFEDAVWLRPGVEVRGYAALSMLGP
jgi:uncharacterized protein (TIGR03663 family)